MSNIDAKTNRTKRKKKDHFDSNRNFNTPLFIMDIIEDQQGNKRLEEHSKPTRTNRYF